MEQVYEQFFLLKYHGNWSLIEAYNLPVGLRTWFFNRLVKQKKTKQKPTPPPAINQNNLKNQDLN